MIKISEPDPALSRLPRTYYLVGHTLARRLPVCADDTPEDLAREIDAAKTKVSSLCPVTPAEYEWAAAQVSMLAHVSACMAELRDPALGFQQRMQVRAQMTSMLRQAAGAQRTLERMMVRREKRDADPAQAQSAEWAEHIAYSTMTRPFAQVFGAAEGGAEPGADVEVVGGGPAPAMTFESDGRELAPSLEPDLETESEDPPDVAWYEAVYPERAAVIRAYGGVPPDARFGPPDGAMVRALLAAGSSVRGVGPPG